MNQSVPELLRQGLIITTIGMTLVFAVLGLLWGIMALLTRVFREAAPAVRLPQEGEADAGMIQASVVVEVGIVEALTVERDRVAAVVAGALMANTVPLLMEAPVGPAFEHGRRLADLGLVQPGPGTAIVATATRRRDATTGH